jgi:hypothetical protein
MESNMTESDSFRSMRTAFEDVFPRDFDAVISFKNGCTRMGFYRLNFQTALQRQQAAEALCETIADDRLPEPHWKDGRLWFWLREVEAYIAFKHAE